MDTIEKITKLHDEIEKSIFTIEPVYPYDNLDTKFIESCELINQVEGTESWCYIGECGHCDLASMIVGAYWHYAEWHDGQDSLSYAALCALGSIFSPNMSEGPEEETTEEVCYNMLEELANNS